jgi:prepilin peptidase CpaA
MIDAISLACFVALAAAAAWSDLRHRRVSNRLVVVVLAAGVARQAATLHPTNLLLGLAGVAVGLALLLPAFAARWVGGGDAKLLAALGMWMGPWSVLLGGVLGVALGGVLAASMAIAGGVGREVAGNLNAAITTRTAPIAPRRGRALIVPLAVPLAVGCTVVMFGGLS